MNLPILELWYAALRHPIGVSVTCSNALKFKQKLYQVRKASADPALADLMILTSPRNPDGEVFIAHRNIDFDPELAEVLRNV